MRCARFLRASLYNNNNNITCGARTRRLPRMKMAADDRPVLFFDIDNTLYSKGKNVQQMMAEKIDDYFMTHLSLSSEDAAYLHSRYYKDYGLAIEGLMRHHKVDPMDYNSKVDDALPLDDVIVRDEQLRRLLLDFDRSKVKLWLFTNAYINHGRRVVGLLGVEDCFEGITYCDYSAGTFVCKPQEQMYAKAQAEAGISDASRCYFIDDSALNCRAAKELGWESVLYVEPAHSDGECDESVAKHVVKDLEELRRLFPQFLKTEAVANGV